MKQRVLIVSKFYYNRGGACVCAINLASLLREKGHEVAVFSMQYDKNIDCETSSYFVSEVGFSNGGIKGKINMAKRVLGYGDIKTSFARILNDFRPDVVHFNNIHSYLSPVVVKMARDFGARTVWTIHDYKLLCPAYTCERNGEPCEICFTNKLGVVKHRCMKNSLAASVLGYLEAVKWNRKLLSDSTDKFICPSHFMEEKMIKGGFPNTVTLFNFVDPDKLALLQSVDVNSERNYYCYIGRLSKEKGLITLLDAASALGLPIKVAGTGPMEEELHSRYANVKCIEFVGHCDAQRVARLFAGARFSVLPSEWYENNPLSVIESLVAGTPVVGANIGGIPELIAEGCGATFPSGDCEALKKAIQEMWSHEFDNAAIREHAISTFSPDAHYTQLMTLYNR